MSAPDPEGFSMLAKVLAAGTAVAVPVWGFFKLWNGKADKHTVGNQLQEVKSEIALNRQVTRDDIRQLYQNAEADRKLVRDGFEKLSKEISETHIALLTRMDKS
jgi:hypothetical protein